MALITYGTSHVQGESSFRIPLSLFFIIPAIVLCATWFMVEVGFAF